MFAPSTGGGIWSGGNVMPKASALIQSMSGTMGRICSGGSVHQTVLSGDGASAVNVGIVMGCGRLRPPSSSRLAATINYRIGNAGGVDVHHVVDGIDGECLVC